MEDLFNKYVLVSKKNFSNETRQKLIGFLGDIDEWDDRPYKSVYLFSNKSSPAHIILALERELSQSIVGCRRWIFTKDWKPIQYVDGTNMPPMECRMELNLRHYKTEIN